MVYCREEDKVEEARMKEDSVEETTEENMSSSYMLLNIAHDYLGRYVDLLLYSCNILLFFYRLGFLCP